MEHANFTMKKKITRGDLTLNPVHPISLSQKLSLLEDPLESLKQSLSTVQEPPVLSSLNNARPSLFTGLCSLVFARPHEESSHTPFSIHAQSF